MPRLASVAAMSSPPPAAGAGFGSSLPPKSFFSQPMRVRVPDCFVAIRATELLAMTDLLEDDEQIPAFDAVALVDVDLLDDAGDRARQGHLHLHGLEHDQLLV